jgi:hypothetical protein
MLAFIIAIIAAVGIAIGGAVVLNSMQKDVEVAFHSPTGARL